MADYWKSTPRHYCKYCNVWINDDKPSRSIHEGGNRHKKNVERFLGNLQRKDEEDKREKETVRRTMLEVERKAMKQFAADLSNPATAGVGAGGSLLAASSAGKPGQPRGTKRGLYDYGIGKKRNEDGEEEDVAEGEEDFDSNFDYNSLWRQPAQPALPATAAAAPIIVKSTDQYGDWTVVEPEVAPVSVAPPPAAPGSTAEWFEKKNTRHARPENVSSGGERAFGTSIDIGGVEERDPDDLRNFRVVERTIDTGGDDDLASLPLPRARAPAGNGANGGGGWTKVDDVKSDVKDESKAEVKDEVKDEVSVKAEGEEKEAAVQDAPGGAEDTGAAQTNLFKKRKVAGQNLRKK
ncbi:hypothetical protein DFJ74DRAFT_672188 [Hyaloraphidium curvatum]|nr:hypothetical protein DFJ74DRAFT_672188 [Hyaloraphidium curvatum]